MSRPDLCDAVFLSPRALRGGQRRPRGGFLGASGGVAAAGSLPRGVAAAMESGAAGSHACAHAGVCPSRPTLGFKPGLSLQVPFPADLRPLPSHRLQVRCARLRGRCKDTALQQLERRWCRGQRRLRPTPCSPGVSLARPGPGAAAGT